MPRNQPTLHEAMRLILLDQPQQTATLETLSEENARRDLYRQKKGDGKHPEPFQFKLRALHHPDWFNLLDGDQVRHIGD